MTPLEAPATPAPTGLHPLHILLARFYILSAEVVADQKFLKARCCFTDVTHIVPVHNPRCRFSLILIMNRKDCYV
jgi:hypothetical protein